MFGFAPFESELSLEHDSCLLKNINEKDRRKKVKFRRKDRTQRQKYKKTMKERQKTGKEK